MYSEITCPAAAFYAADPKRHDFRLNVSQSFGKQATNRPSTVQEDYFDNLNLIKFKSNACKLGPYTEFGRQKNAINRKCSSEWYVVRQAVLTEEETKG
jgi:hypothetical protein